MTITVDRKDLCKLVDSLALLTGAFEDGRDISAYELDPEDDRLVEEMGQTVRLGQSMITKTDINERIAFESKTKEYKEGVLTGLDWALDRSRMVRSCYNDNALHHQADGITEMIYELKKMRKAVQK